MTALIALSAGGAALAKRLQTALPDARIHGLRRRVGAADVLFDDTGEHLRAAVCCERADHRHLRRRHPDPLPGAAAQ